MTYGDIGIKVWIYKGEIFKKDEVKNEFLEYLLIFIFHFNLLPCYSQKSKTSQVVHHAQERCKEAVKTETRGIEVSFGSYGLKAMNMAASLPIRSSQPAKPPCTMPARPAKSGSASFPIILLPKSRPK